MVRRRTDMEVRSELPSAKLVVQSLYYSRRSPEFPSGMPRQIARDAIFPDPSRSRRLDRVILHAVMAHAVTSKVKGDHNG